MHVKAQGKSNAQLVITKRT